MKAKFFQTEIRYNMVLAVQKHTDFSYPRNTVLNQRGCLPYGKIPQIPAILNSPPGLPSRQVRFARGRPRFAPLTVQRYSALSMHAKYNTHLAYGNCARGTSGSQNRGVLSVRPVGVLQNARCTGFSFPVTVQNAPTENSSILREKQELIATDE